MSFIMLSESQIGSKPEVIKDDQSHDVNAVAPGSTQRSSTSGRDTSRSQQVESAKQLFEILSSRSDIDHPICSECTELLLASLQARLSASTKERDAFIAFLKSLNNNPPAPAEVEKAQSSLASTKAAEVKAFKDLVEAENEKARLEEEIANLEAESLALDEEEQTFWQSRNAFALELSRYQNERDALSAAYEHDAQQLERLQRTNVYNDTFSIGHDGFFGTINGLRLGRLPPPQNVDWSEINAAWGTAALLLATVAEKLNITFRNYQIKPMGSTSTIQRLDYSSPQHSTVSNARHTSSASSQQSEPKVTSLELFSSGDLPLGRMLLHRRLDAGMVAFLECLRQLGEFVEAGNDGPVSIPVSNLTSPRRAGSKDPTPPQTNLQLPYKIYKDKINDISIKLSASTDEAWTRACKYTLTCCKYVLAHASNVGAPASAREG